jgi:hypothetical protein
VGEFLGPVTPGSPGVFVGGLVALILVVFTDTWAESLVIVGHEGGHAFVALLTGREVFSLRVNETAGGGATQHGGGWGVGRIFISSRATSRRRSWGWPGRHSCSRQVVVGSLGVDRI